MKERPILFSAPMVRAILDGSKTQTRRVVKPQPACRKGAYCDPYNHNYDHFTFWTKHHAMILGAGGNIPKTAHWRCPYGQPGDRLWVREAFCLEGSPDYSLDESQYPRDGRPVKKDVNMGEGEGWLVPWYRATDGEPNIVPEDLVDLGDDRTRWRPSIHMPRWASRILLEVVDVRVQRVQEISEEDAAREGLRRDGKDYLYASEALNKLGQRSPTAQWAFQDLWDSINAPRGFGWQANPWVWAITFKRI